MDKKYDMFGIELKEGDYVMGLDTGKITKSRGMVLCEIIGFTKQKVRLQIQRYDSVILKEPKTLAKLLINPKKIDNEKFNEIQSCIVDNFPELFV